MSYLAFLQQLLTVGATKLPRVIAFLQAVMDLLTQYSDILTLAPTHNSSEPTAEEAELEAKVIADSHVHGAIGDGTLLRNLFAFISAHPELLTLLLTLIKK